MDIYKRGLTYIAPRFFPYRPVHKIHTNAGQQEQKLFFNFNFCFMAISNTPTRVYVTTTGASGASGFTGAAAAHATAIGTAVTAAQNVAGVLPATIAIGATQFGTDPSGIVTDFLTSINYVVQVVS